MPPLPSTTQQQYEPFLKSHLRQEFEIGFALARDPQNADLPELALRTTTLYSPWYTLSCVECKQNFREGDQVRICPKCGRVYHDDRQYNLLCWQKHFANGQPCSVARINPFDQSQIAGCDFCWSGDLVDSEKQRLPAANQVARIPRISSLFLNGLNHVWTHFGDQQIREVPEGSPMIGKPCPWCRFQIRAGDRVVKCPCGECETYFHDDIFRHLTCWDSWNGMQGNAFCPTTGRPLQRKQPGADADDNRLR